MINSKFVPIVVSVILLIVVGSCSSKVDKTNHGETSDTNRELIEKNTTEVSNWHYGSKQDSMDDSMTFMAGCISIDKDYIGDYFTRLRLGLIYTNQVSMIIIMPEEGLLREDKLPMVYARFDDGDVQTFSVIADGGKAVYIVDYDNFFEQLIKSKEVALKVETADYRTATFKFNTEGLVWDYPQNG